MATARIIVLTCQLLILLAAGSNLLLARSPPSHGNSGRTCAKLFRNDGGCGVSSLPAPGVRHKRMVNGVTVTETGRWPWYVQVSLGCSPRYIVRTDEGEFEEVNAWNRWQGCARCGGSIVSKHWILTAGHCADPKILCGRVCTQPDAWFMESLREKYADKGVRDVEFAPEYREWINAGSVLDRQRTDPEAGEQTVISQTWYTHPNYTVYHGMGRTRVDDDITLIYVDEGFDFNERVFPVCVNANPEQEGCGPRNGQDCYQAGLALHDDLREAKVQYQSKARCDAALGEICEDKMGSSASPVCRVKADKICSRDRTKTYSACDGDSGGPFVCNLQGAWTSVGVVQDVIEVERSCDPAGLNLHSDVANFVPWITRTVLKHERRLGNNHRSIA